MNDEQIDRLLKELVDTRKAFNEAINMIRWNRINTVIQYILILVVVLMLISGGLYYLDEREASCERGNNLRASIQTSLDDNARAIGSALAIVTNSPEERFREYMEAYRQQERPEVLKPREC